MRKFMVVVAMLAMMLVAAAPAFAQSTAVQFDGDDVNTGISNNSIELQNITQTSGDQNAAAVDESVAFNSANTLSVSSAQVNESFNLSVLFR